MKTIIYPQNTGSLGIVYPAPNTNIDQLIETILTPGTPYKIVDNLHDQIDFTFFEAYEFTLDGPYFNVNKAHNIWKNKWRQKRQEKLQKLDIEYIRAVELNDKLKQQEISSLKQQLRDITNTVLPKTPHEIRNTWPTILLD